MQLAPSTLMDVTAQADPQKDLPTVLVVEDDPRMQKVLQRLFLEAEFRVILAGDGKTALDSFRFYKPVAVVLDLVLPEISGATSVVYSKPYRAILPWSY